MSTIRTFKEKVDYCRENLAPDLIENSAISHARYLFQNLLKVAVEQKEPVRLVSGDLSDDFYRSLSEEIDDCISAELPIELLVLNGDVNLDDNSIASKVEGYKNGSVVKSPAGFILHAQHMLLIGNNGERYRLETDHEHTKAIASFKSDGMGAMLIDSFRKLKVILEEANRDGVVLPTAKA